MSAKLLIGPLLALLLAAGGAHAQTLQQAREQVDAGQYGRALPVYEALLREQPANTELLIETARVYGFADRHPEAIATYRRVIEADPARRRDVVAALAWQTLWSGDAAAALPLFAEARGATKDPQAQADLWRGTGEA